MMDFDTIEVKLSDAMKQRIASGTAGQTEDEAKAKVKALAQAALKFPPDVPAKEAALAQMKAHEIDLEADLEYQRVTYPSAAVPPPPPPPRYTIGLVSLMIKGARPYEGNEPLLEEAIAQVTPDFTGTGKVPMFAYAFWMAESYAEPWMICVKDGRFDLEKKFDVWADTSQGHWGPPDWVELHGSLLNQLCHYNEEIFRRYGYLSEAQTIAYLLHAGAILDPAYIHRPEVSMMVGNNYKTDWEKQWDDLKQAIATKDKPALDACLQKGAVARGFSLGHKHEMCRPDFWGPFLNEGKTAILSLPEWVQEHMAVYLPRLIMSHMPTPVVQNWTHQTVVSPPPATPSKAP